MQNISKVFNEIDKYINDIKNILILENKISEIDISTSFIKNILGDGIIISEGRPLWFFEIKKNILKCSLFYKENILFILKSGDWHYVSNFGLISGNTKSKYRVVHKQI
jgi:hypothetical protein